MMLEVEIGSVQLVDKGKAAVRLSGTRFGTGLAGSSGFREEPRFGTGFAKPNSWVRKTRYWVPHGTPLLGSQRKKVEKEERAEG
ncbi:hypothetical protein SLEP1_g6 [Rubroshorea leprosula]|uniref:Uncharacterized protein n=1 Tax=Rubroshorea leprosula TaxID=152421 RepID=A0AAV5HIF9_9ROSI|nr:hypothetical protein SLEP1_g6 [Rubroshorea leprosula]